MVQRKLPAKLSLQPHTLSLSNHHDIKSPRGADLKAKKMKKSGSIKRPKQPGQPPPPPPLPNYMKPTTSSDARKEKPRLQSKNPSFKPARAGVVRKRVVCENLDAKKPTCSSTLKDCKFPAYLSLSPGGTESEGTSAIKVCPYTYCSLNGHHRAPLPPLKCFLSARRKAVKTQRGVVGGDDFVGEQSEGFFLEIYAADGGGVDEAVADDQEGVCDEFDGESQEVSFEEEIDEEFLSGSDTANDSDGSDMEWEAVDYSPLRLEAEPEPEAEVSKEQIIEDEFIVNPDSKDCCFDENLVEEVSQESFDEEGFSSDAFSSSDDGDCTGLYDDFKTSSSLQFLLEEAGARDEVNHDHEASSEILNHVDDEPAVTRDESAEDEGGVFTKANRKYAAERETEVDVVLLQFTAKAKEVGEDGDELGDFNPRAPNFLPVEPDPEAQKVDLRHQDLDERKNAEEWMVDYALRQVVTKLGPARKRKVSLLVEAFEKVMPAAKWDLQLRHGSAFDQARPIQACR